MSMVISIGAGAYMYQLNQWYNWLIGFYKLYSPDFTASGVVALTGRRSSGKDLL